MRPRKARQGKKTTKTTKFLTSPRRKLYFEIWRSRCAKLCSNIPPFSLVQTFSYSCFSHSSQKWTHGRGVRRLKSLLGLKGVILFQPKRFLLVLAEKEERKKTNSFFTRRHTAVGGFQTAYARRCGLRWKKNEHRGLVHVRRVQRAFGSMYGLVCVYRYERRRRREKKEEEEKEKRRRRRRRRRRRSNGAYRTFIFLRSLYVWGR